MTDERPALPDPDGWRINKTDDGWLPVRIADEATPLEPFTTKDEAVAAVLDSPAT